MPIAILVIGLALLVSVYHGTQKELGTQLVKDFTGQGNFLYWLIAVTVIGGIGYIPALQKPSRALLGLVVLGILLSNKGFFAQFEASLKTDTAKGMTTTQDQNTAPVAPEIKISGGAGSVVSGGSDIAGGVDAISKVSSAASIFGLFA